MPMLRPLLALLLLSRLAVAQNSLPPPARLDSAAHALSVAEFQRNLNHEFSDPKESPLSAAERQAFQSLSYYPVGYGYYVVARLVRDSTAAPFTMVTSTDRRPLYRKYGTLYFILAGQPQQLSVYQSLDLLQRPGLEDYLMVPFTDLTNAHGSYGGGRYLDLRLPPAGSTILLLDFNRAYNPSCAYNHAYSCPVPPAENRLRVAVPAGVRD
ncbi:DUF1684 domain-containing protein [uncultured Hymenobacter sp.]|uniref:DUF1684 domain-containing protein n=1 Tax=uncultured Hymenobacter sp. TaxID=170016 RepID=UPI0035CBF95A